MSNHLLKRNCLAMRLFFPKKKKRKSTSIEIIRNELRLINNYIPSNAYSESLGMVNRQLETSDAEDNIYDHRFPLIFSLAKQKYAIEKNHSDLECVYRHSFLSRFLSQG